MQEMDVIELSDSSHGETMEVGDAGAPSTESANHAADIFAGDTVAQTDEASLMVEELLESRNPNCGEGSNPSGSSRFNLMRKLAAWDRSRLGYRFVKRVFDIVFSLVVIVIAFIPGALLCIAIAIESPGCPLYKQKRVGRIGSDGKPREFTMWKFRSMVKDADKMKDALLAENEVEGPMFKMKDDPRVTGIGKFIRKHSIDEFPQFINVFLGDMSIVGPRPPLPREVEQYDEWAMQRLAVKPGLTGPWQVGGRSDLDFDDMVGLDLGYIAKRSIKTDLILIVQTVVVVISGQGAA